MGLTKAVLNFMVKKGTGELVTSSLLRTKPKIPMNTKGLKYVPELKADTYVKKIETWFDSEGHITPFAKRGETEVVGHHGFNGWNSNETIEDAMRIFKEKHPDANQEKTLMALERTKKRIAESNIDKISVNDSFLSLKPQPYASTAYRGRQRKIGSQLGSDFDIIDKAKVGDEIVPTGGFAYAAHHKFGTYQYMGSPYDYMGNVKFEPMLIEYKIPKGAQVSSNMEHGGEVVFPALSKFKLISKETRYIEQLDVKTGDPIGSYPYKHVVLEYIPDIPVLKKSLEGMTDAEYELLLSKAKECANWAEFTELIKNLSI